ncbi:50S ribosomal protein L6 [Silvanigrella paludirubra]|jgi:large subunit ribosomal protein L6|uniref:Large ribosomal subunit protein uL6 n=1 Tax=Silvanigrella paludirubra TaxID=2499159 RepID=A0A6N6VSC4_9BACT|nr:50S ribosomal protein L6 [Silvanigrella paludirubra]KAB8037596.1 50S ribosomal protein L6 [Silvanigrella paludirubra]
MSRVGKQPIKIPSGVTVKLSGTILEVNGSKGTMKRDTFGRIAIAQENNEVVVSANNGENSSAYWGLYRTLLSNMVQGVSAGFSKSLEIQGTGYRAAMAGKVLNLTVGFSHPVNIEPPTGITFEVDKAGKVNISGVDKELVGQMAAKVRSVRPAEPYQGKGIRYAGEVIVTKVGKSAGKK